MPNWIHLDANPATLKICTTTDERLYQLHDSGAIWYYTGVPYTGWLKLDQNPATVDIVAIRDKLYQRHRDGKIWEYTSPPLTGWRLLDQNPNTVEITATPGLLFQRHRTGDIWKYIGTPLTGWQRIDSNPLNVQIAATPNALYKRQSDGKVWQQLHSRSDWTMIGEYASIRKMVVSPDGTVYLLLFNGNILRWTGSGSRWDVLSRDRLTIQIAAAEGGELYQLRSNGHILRFTGTPISGWELWDTNQQTAEIAAAARGMLFQRHARGDIFRDRFYGQVDYKLFLASVRCVDETDHESGLFDLRSEDFANDAMRLKLIQTSQKTGQEVKQNVSPLINLGSNYQDGTVVPMNREIAHFVLRRNEQLPMSIVVSFFLIEEDWFGDLSQIEEGIRGYAKTTAGVHGTLSSVIKLLGLPGGWQIGAQIGSIAAVVEPAIANAVLAGANDVFPVTDITVAIADRNAALPPEVQTPRLRFVGHGGEYQLVCRWQRIEQVPSPLVELI